MRCVYSQTARDNDGNIVVGAIIRVYLAGTTTPASIYQYLSDTSPITAVRSGSDGEFTFYIDRFDYDTDQKFKIVISKGTVATTYDDIEIDRVVLGTYTISTDKTVTTHINVPKGVIYSIDSGKTLTINGTIVAGPYQIFSGSGIVTGLKHAYPEWWGIDGTTDNTQIAAAAAALTSGGVLQLNIGEYSIDAPVYISVDDVTVRGMGRGTVLKISGDVGDQSVLRANADGIVIENLTIDGNRSVNTSATQQSHAINIEAGKKKIKVQNCWLQNMMGDGVNINKTSEDIQVLNNWMIDNYRNGVSDVGGYRHNIIGNQIVSTSTNIVGCIDLEPDGDNNLEDILVKGNTCYVTGTKPYGIVAALDNVTTDTKLKNIQIEGNIIHGDGTDGPTVGIYGRGARYVDFINNEVYTPKTDGIFLDDGATNASHSCSVTGNAVFGAVRYAIKSEADNTPVQNNKVRAVAGSTMTHGIYFEKTSGFLCTGNDVYIPSITGTTTYGILAEVATVTDFIIADNHVYSDAVDTNYGIWLADATLGQVRGNFVENFVAGITLGTTAADSVWVRQNDYSGCTTNYVNTSRTVIGTINLSTRGTSLIYSAAGAVTATLPDGDEVGQIKVIKMSNATATSTVSVTHHETSDPEIFEFGAVTDILVLMWNGLEWVTINNQGVATP